tara:strand:- start:39775 stop:41214 length:1440 start_codon:yes stop_codon:yes gene_type:complete
MASNPIIPVILCGGSGTRLWPLSRESFPKQYLSLSSINEKTLLQVTRERIVGLKNLIDPILICNEEHRFIVAEQMRAIKTNPLSIILEPFGKNTGPAITLAALKALEEENDPILLVLSSDHEIKNKKKFISILERGINYAANEYLVTFGILPDSAETGYGYIQAESPFNLSEIEAKKITKFTEKPDLETALKFLKDKRYLWNSGIFMFKAKTIISEVKKFSPEIFKYCEKAILNSNLDLDFQRIDKNHFNNCPNLSIDISVMEKTSLGKVLPLDAGWSDIGSWEAVWESSKKDKFGNHTKGKIISENNKNCYLRSEDRLLVGIGLHDLIAVETNDAILIADKKKSQEVKNIVQQLKENKIPEGQKHSIIYRPWGYYLSLSEASNWQVKLINVKPGEKLSSQMHKYRSEHWVVVSGIAKVELNNKINTLNENESIYIPLGSQHRLINNSDKSLTIIEVQSGSYLGEDDIVRFDDKYGRIN